MYLCISKCWNNLKLKKKKSELSETRQDKRRNTEGSTTETAEQFDLQGLILPQFHGSGYFNISYEITSQKHNFVVII